MAKIIGTIKDSIGVPVTAYLTITLNAPLYNIATAPDEVYYTKPGTFKVLNGDLEDIEDVNGNPIAAGIVLFPSEEVTYTFYATYEINILILYLDGKEYAKVDPDGQSTGGYWHLHSDDNYYTGEIHTVDSELLTEFVRKNREQLFEPFSAKVPDETNVEWSTLQHVSINSSNIDTSANYVAELITTKYGDQLASGLLFPRGTWGGAIVYNYRDVVYYASTNSLYWYINLTPSSGNLPTDTDYWMLIADGSDYVGGGGTVDPSTFLLNEAFGVSWDGVTNKAPVADVVYDRLIQYALLSGATFTDINVPNQSAGTNNTKAANTSFVTNALAAYTPPAPTTAPTVEQANNTIAIANMLTLKRVLRRYGRITEEKPNGSNGGNGAATNVRFLEFVRENSVIDAAGSVNMLAAVPPYVQVVQGVYYVRGRSICAGVDGHKLHLINSSGTILKSGTSRHCGLTGYQAIYYPNDEAEVEGLIVLNATTNLGLRHDFQTFGASIDKGRACGRTGTEVFAELEIWRLD